MRMGRTDVTDGWDGRHPLDVPVVVVTHGVPGVSRAGCRTRLRRWPT